MTKRYKKTGKRKTNNLAIVRNKNRFGTQLYYKIRRVAVAVIIFLLMMTAVIYSFKMAEEIVKPAVNNSAELKTRQIVEKLVLQSVYDVIGQPDDTDSQIICTSSDSAGKVSLVTLNTSILNRIGTEIATVVNSSVSEGNEHIMRVNLGSILGSKILSQVLPNLHFKIIPVAVSDVSYTTEFESVGINQTKYKVFLNIDTEAKLMIPFMAERIKTQNTVLIAEAVIVGEVPQTYADITQDEVSDYIS